MKDKIVLVLRKRDTHRGDNGVWLATTKDHHKGLMKDLPSMQSLRVLGNRETNWQVLPEDADDFEDGVTKACDFILKGDLRIGKVPNQRQKKERII